jgi:hypothetical protein
LYAQLSYIYKPDNTLALAYKGGLDDSRTVAVVDLQPQTFYHSLTGGDLTYRVDQVRMGISGLWDRPNKSPVLDDSWTYQVFDDAFLLSPFLEWNNGIWGISMQRLDIFGGDAHEEGELASPTRAPLVNLYPYREANQVALLMNLHIGHGERVYTKLSYTFSEKNDFELIRWNARYRLSRLWSLFSELELIKAGPTSLSNENSIYQYANNDRFMAGAIYAF